MTQRTVKSALRVLEVLKLFADRKKALSQTDIYHGLDIPQSSSNFLLRTMIEAGYLTYHRESRVYFPTPEVLHLGKWLEGFGYDFLFGESVITYLMQELGDRTEETVSITSQNDIFVHFHRINPRNRPSELQFDQGLVVPLTYSSYGQMLLSRQTDRQIDRVCRLIKARETNPARRFDLKEMIGRITAMRAHEYAYSLNPMLPAAGSVATILPITIAGRDVAIGVGGPARRIEENLDAILTAMRETIEDHRSRLLAVFGNEHVLPDASVSRPTASA